VAPEGAELALSHDGKKLLYTRSDSKTSPDRTIVLYDLDSGKSLIYCVPGAASLLVT